MKCGGEPAMAASFRAPSLFRSELFLSSCSPALGASVAGGVKRSSFSVKSRRKMAMEGSEAADAEKSQGMLTRRGLSLVPTLSALLPLFHNFKNGSVLHAAELDLSETSLIIDEIRKVMTKIKAAGFLRLVFHDAGTFSLDDRSGGMNGSIIYELDRPENAGLSKSVKVLEKVKKELDDVSWADIIAVAGAEAVSTCGGPVIKVKLGRMDSSAPDPDSRLPQESLDAPALKEVFLSKGFSTQELVALSGAHTLGSKGFGKPTVFDNAYFKVLLEKPWQSAGTGAMSSMIGLPSDRALIEDKECMRWIRLYANTEETFFRDFKTAYTKLVNTGAQWRSGLSKIPY